MLAIRGRCIQRKQLSTGSRFVAICISGWLIVDLGPLSAGTVTSWGGWRFGRRWRRLWSWLSVSVGARCACSFASPVYPRILWRTILAWTASGRLLLTKHSRVSFYCRVHISMPRNLNTPLLLYSDVGVRWCDRTLGFLCCRSQKAFLGHFRYIQSKPYVGLFQLYLTSLPWHSSRHVANIQEISCCL